MLLQQKQQPVNWSRGRERERYTHTHTHTHYFSSCAGLYLLGMRNSEFARISCAFCGIFASTVESQITTTTTTLLARYVAWRCVRVRACFGWEESEE